MIGPATNGVNCISHAGRRAGRDGRRDGVSDRVDSRPRGARLGGLRRGAARDI